MTLRFTDGFDSYAATADLLKKWTSNGGATWSATAGRNGGGGLVFSNTNSAIKTFPLTTSGNNANVIVWFKSTAKPASTLGVIVWQDVNSANLGYFTVTSAGLLQLTSGGNGILATGTTNICDGNWHFIETQINLAGSAQTQILWVDGLQQFNASVRVNSQGSNAVSALELAGLTNGATVTYDDIVMFDGSGSSPINSDQPIGPQQINTLRPSSDSAVQFSPDTGATNYTQVNEVNGDTTHYVQDGTSGHQDLYSYDDLSFSPAKIWGVMANAYANNPGIGAINHNQLCKNNTTTTTGTTTQTPITNARVVQEPFVLDPNTGLAWASSTALNTALFGIKVT